MSGTTAPILAEVDSGKVVTSQFIIHGDKAELQGFNFVPGSKFLVIKAFEPSQELTAYNVKLLFFTEETLKKIKEIDTKTLYFPLGATWGQFSQEYHVVDTHFFLNTDKSQFKWSTVFYDSSSNYKLNISNQWLDASTTQCTVVGSTDANCSSCQIFNPEKCNACKNGFQISGENSKCVPGPNAFIIKKKIYQKSEQLVVLSFSQPLVDTDFASFLSIEMKDQEGEIFTNYQITSISRASSPNRHHQLKIHLRFNKELINGTLILKNTSNSSLSLIQSESNQSYNIGYLYAIEVTKITHIPSILTKPLDLVSKVGGYSFNLIVLAMMLLNLPLAVTLVKLYQSFGILVLININLPANIISFFDFFKNDIFNMLPEINFVSEEKMNCAVEGKFESEDFSCSFLNNNSSVIIQFSFLALVKLTTKLLVLKLRRQYNNKLKQVVSMKKTAVKITSKVEISDQEEEKDNKDSSSTSSSKSSSNDEDQGRLQHIKNPDRQTTHMTVQKNCCQSNIEKLDSYLNLAFFVYLTNAAQFDIILTGFVNFAFLNFTSVFHLLNQMATIIVMTSLALLLLKCISIMVNMEKIYSLNEIKSIQLKIMYRKWLFLRLEMKETAKLVFKLAPECTIAIDFIIGFVLGIFYKNGLSQLITIIIMKASLIYILCQRPFKEERESTITIVNESVYFLVLIIFLFLKLTESSSVFNPELRFRLFGNIVIFLLILLLIYNMIIGTIDCIDRLKEIRKKKNESIEGKEKINMLGIVMQLQSQYGPHEQKNEDNSAEKGVNIPQKLPEKERKESVLSKRTNKPVMIFKKQKKQFRRLSQAITPFSIKLSKSREEDKLNKFIGSDDFSENQINKNLQIPLNDFEKKFKFDKLASVSSNPKSVSSPSQSSSPFEMTPHTISRKSNSQFPPIRTPNLLFKEKRDSKVSLIPDQSCKKKTRRSTSQFEDLLQKHYRINQKRRRQTKF